MKKLTEKLTMKISQNELEVLSSWVSNNDTIPDNIRATIIDLSKLPTYLAEASGNKTALLRLIRTLMKITPSSEKGTLLPGLQGNLNASDSPDAAKLKQDAQNGAKSLAIYRAHLEKLRQKSPSPQIEPADPALINALEKLSASGLATITEESMNLFFSEEDKLKIFGKTKGLHSSTDKVVRYDFDLVIKKLNLKIETLTDFQSGITKRFDISDIGPAKGSFTWLTLSNLTQLHLGYYLPINRMQTLLNLSIFSDVNIYRQLEAQAIMYLPIYIQLGADLSESLLLQFDDTNPNVIEMKKMVKGNFEMKNNIQNKDGKVSKESEESKKKNEIIDLLADEFGRFSPKANGKGLQKKISTTCIAGRSDENDPASEIYFYRTHYGHAGNLVEKILEQRCPANKKLILQGDLAAWNKPSALLVLNFDVIFAGCLSHARRPFKLHAEDDDALCDQMLKYFLILIEMETRIDERGRTFRRTLFYRQKYGKKIWNKILVLSKSVLNSRKLADCIGHYVWPPSSKFGVACKYIEKHFIELTVYLEYPQIPPTNNKIERLLRPEKLFLNNSKYKGTEWGKTCTDILRSITMTCQSAGVPYIEYMKFIYKNQDKIPENPSMFTPYAFSKIRAELASQSFAAAG